ncbi:MAG: T9SS type A sorting domain-containing protein [Flavobacteriales bacterium]
MSLKRLLLPAVLLIALGNVSAQVYHEATFNSSIPSSWTVLDSGNSSVTWEQVTQHPSTGNDLDGTPFAHVNSNQAGLSDTLVEYLISPSLNMSNVDNPAVTFIHYFTLSTNERAYVDVYDGSQWVEVRSWSNDQGSWSNPSEVTIDLSSYRNSNLQVRFRYDDNGVYGLHWSVDSVVIKNEQCFDPSNLEVVEVNANSAYLTWDSPSPNGTWQIEFGPTGFSPGNGDTISSNNDTTAIGPLAADTEYDFYVRELCVNGDSTDWIGPVSFKTRCNTQLLPQDVTMESFSENLNATGYDCWIPDPTNTTGAYRWNTNSGATGSFGTGPDNDHTLGTNSGIYAYTEASSGGAGDVATLASSQLDMGGIQHPVMTFWYHRFGNSMGELHIDVSTDGGDTWDLSVAPPLTGQQQTSNSAAWEQSYVDLGNYNGEVITVRFRAVHDGGLQGDMGIDDIRIREASDRDLKVKEYVNPKKPDCYSSNEEVLFPVVNGGTDSIDLTQSNINVTVEVTGVVTQTFNATITDNSLNGGQPLGTLDSIIVPMGTLNMSSNGFYRLEGYISSISGDTLGTNDTIVQTFDVGVPYGGTVSGGGEYCQGDTASLSVINQVGTIQWQMNNGSGWMDIPATGTDSTTLDVAPDDTALFRVEACTTALSNVDTVFINQVTPPTPVNDTFCKGTDVTAQLGAQGSGDIFWFEDSTSEQLVDSGQSKTVNVQYVDKTFWVSRADSSISDPVLITEIDHGSTDAVEIQNVSTSSVDLSGWTIALNDNSNINNWTNNSDNRWDLSGTLNPGDVLEGNENLGNFNVAWVSNDEGWVILFDDNGSVVDLAPFGWTQSDIQNFNTTILGTNVNGTDHWSGAGITSCGSGETYQRIGSDDNDIPSDWICSSSPSLGSQNTGIDHPFGGCRSERVPVTAFAEDCSGMESFVEGRSFSLFPNPVDDDRFFIEMSGGKAIQGTLRIRDLKGRVIEGRTLTLQNGKNVLETKGLAKGVYMIHFLSRKGSFTKKLLVR